MNTTHRTVLLSLAALTVAAACSSEDDATSLGAGGALNPGGFGGAGGTPPGQGGVTTGTGGVTTGTGGAGTGGIVVGTGGAGGLGAGGGPETGGAFGSGGDSGDGGALGSGGTASGGDSGNGGTASGGTPGAGGNAGKACCADGDCLCHGPAPTQLTSGNGPFRTASYRGRTGTIYYPTDAEPPFAGLAVCGGYLNTGPEMNPWGAFYASHGIVTIITSTGSSDQPATRATKLLGSIAELKEEATKSGGQLNGKMAGRYGTSGYSMGGGGTTIATQQDKTLLTSVGLAPYNGRGQSVTTPTLLLCGGSDRTAPCSMSTSVYNAMGDSVPKMQISINGVSHLEWFGPTTAGGGTSGKYALAFQKVYLEGDERWKTLLVSRPSNGTQTTNIQ